MTFLFLVGHEFTVMAASGMAAQAKIAKIRLRSSAGSGLELMGYILRAKRAGHNPRIISNVSPRESLKVEAFGDLIVELVNVRFMLFLLWLAK